MIHIDPLGATAFAGMLGGYLVKLAVARNNRHAQDQTDRLANRKATLEELEALGDRLTAEIQRLSSELEDERKARRAAEERAEEERTRAREAKDEAVGLTKRVAQLEKVLRDNNFEIPEA